MPEAQNETDSCMTGQCDNSWPAVLAAGVKAQRLVPDAVAVGGTAAALYAHHRVSQDTDHLLPSLRTQFDHVRATLELSPHWRTARVESPVLILGSIDGVPVGFRQSRRLDPIATRTLQTEYGPLVVPTLDELIGMKGYLAYARNALRDYLDFAALTHCTDEPAVLEALLKSDQRYGHLQTTSVALEIAKRLSDPAPYDLDDIDLHDYKGLAPPWRSWEMIAATCRKLAGSLSRRLVLEG